MSMSRLQSEERYEALKAKLLENDFGELLAVQSVPLVERLLLTALEAESLRGLAEEKYERTRRDHLASEHQLLPLKEDNARLLHENNALHLELIHEAEQEDETQRLHQMSIDRLKSQVGDLQFLNLQCNQRVRSLWSVLPLLRPPSPPSSDLRGPPARRSAEGWRTDGPPPWLGARGGCAVGEAPAAAAGVDAERRRREGEEAAHGHVPRGGRAGLAGGAGPERVPAAGPGRDQGAAHRSRPSPAVWSCWPAASSARILPRYSRPGVPTNRSRRSRSWRPRSRKRRCS